MAGRSYGSKGRVGIGAPQANPTVEPEMRLLLPPDIAMYTTRLTSPSPDARTRTLEYFNRLPEYLNNFASLELDAFGFACTGSSYLVGRTAEDDMRDRLEQERGYPIITATHAIRVGLEDLGANRIAIVAPYPDWLVEASHAYWQAAGYIISETRQVDIGSMDTVHIYDLEFGPANEAARAVDTSACDCILMTGTGMPSLPTIRNLQSEISVPLLSSNLCIAWALLQSLKLDPTEGPLSDELARHSLINGWQNRIDA